MPERWFTENWTQYMGNTDELLDDIRRHAAQLQNQKIDELLRQAEEQRAAAEEGLRAFGARRQSLLDTLDALQSELAVAGLPIRGEVS